MKAAPFDYVAPSRVDEVVHHLAGHDGHARVIAGGQSLVPLMAFRLAQPSVLVDLRRVVSLRTVQVGASHVTLGAMVTQAAAGGIAELHPLVRDAVPLVAHAQVRNRGTVGGSIAHADPAAELPAVAVALGAGVGVASLSGERWIPAGEFFVSCFSTALAPEEVVTAVQFPKRVPGEGWAILEVARRPGDFAIAGVVVRLVVHEARIGDAAIVTFGVGDRPCRAEEAGRSLVGSEPRPEAFTAAATGTAAGVAPPSDVHASGSYRRRAIRVLTDRALRVAALRAGEAG